MLQHYSVSWKKGLAALCLLAVAGLSGCDQKENAAAKVEYDGLSNSQPLRVDANNHTVTMLVQINGRFLTDDTRHGIVFKDGSNGHKSLFMGYATPKAFYEALKEAGGTPGENMTMDNKETTHVTGSKLDISVNWQGAAKAYSFDEVIVDSNGKKLDMRFGGNLTAAEEKKTGCLVCLDSCPVGIVSNATPSRRPRWPASRALRYCWPGFGRGRSPYCPGASMPTRSARRGRRAKPRIPRGRRNSGAAGCV